MSTSRRAGTPSRRPDPSGAARHQRDAALDRGRAITRGIAFGSVAAVAAAGIYLSQALPGHAATTSGTSTGGATTSGAPAPVDTGPSDGSASSQGAGLSAPAQAPAPATQPAPVVSGSS